MKKFFTKTNIIIILLVVFFALLAVYLYNSAHEDAAPEIPGGEEVMGEIEVLQKMREDVDFSTQDDEDTQYQIDELEKLRGN